MRSFARLAAGARSTRSALAFLKHLGSTRLSTTGLLATASHGSPEEVHTIHREGDKVDLYLDKVARNIFSQAFVPIETLHSQYQHEAGAMIPSVVPYEERPPARKRADIVLTSQPINTEATEGDGIVLVVHAQYDNERSRLAKVVVCSGFVVDASITRQDQGDIIVTCAHTLEEMHRHVKYRSGNIEQTSTTFSFILPSTSNDPPTPRLITRLLSSMPRTDAIILEARPVSSCSRRLRPLPLTPFPVYPGTPVLTHLFGSPEPPIIQRSIARTKRPVHKVDSDDSEVPVSWLDGHAYRRWGRGVMLGYRSYTGLVVEAGISSVLPHILTSILPTPGSSGGPLVNAQTGCVVGMTSGRRMDNRVEGERGWGCSSESIFEMFSLPGFMPASH